jgi:hypothetical protein
LCNFLVQIKEAHLRHLLAILANRRKCLQFNDMTVVNCHGVKDEVNVSLRAWIWPGNTGSHVILRTRKESTMNDAMVHPEGFAVRCHKVLQVAQELFQKKPDWVTFFREMLGVSGSARSVFTSQDEYVLFEKSREYAEIQNMVLSLRNRKIPGSGGAVNEPTRVITVRLPESLHEALKAEAADHKTSMNKLCISKLLQVLGDQPQRQMPRVAPGTRHVPAPSNPGSIPTLPMSAAGNLAGTAPKANGPVLPAAPQTPSFRSTFNSSSQPNVPNLKYGS